VDPPSEGGLGRHDDPITGVAPWWSRFAVTFDWNFEGIPASEAAPVASTPAKK
jgi:uncharacterized protein involved in high-affinity Fe2+ transport